MRASVDERPAPPLSVVRSRDAETANDWHADKRWSDRFIPEIRHAVAPHIIGEAPAEDDQERNTDLTVIRAEPVRIACRVRRPNRYSPHEFTLRSGRPNGAKTELQKVLEGWGDYMFYGHADETERRLRAWSLLDLRVFRLWLQRYPYRNGGRAPGVEKAYRDR